MAFPEEEGARAVQVEALVEGFVTERQARSIAAQHPEVFKFLAVWIREAALSRKWRRAEKLANLAAPLRAPGLGEVLREILDADIPELNNEDFVDILGELREVEAVACIFRVAERSVSADAPAFWLCQKVISSLGEIGTAEALGHIRDMTARSWPDAVRWHAAVELRIEEQLGFDEDEMLE